MEPQTSGDQTSDHQDVRKHAHNLCNLKIMDKLELFGFQLVREESNLRPDPAKSQARSSEQAAAER